MATAAVAAKNTSSGIAGVVVVVSSRRFFRSQAFKHATTHGKKQYNEQQKTTVAMRIHGLPSTVVMSLSVKLPSP
jgi:hypothetical protein